LFVLTVAPQTPLANFYYRHFYRLVNPTMTPIPLEPNNPDSIRSHAFSSTLDFLAKRGIDIFNIINIHHDESVVEAGFKSAQSFLQNSRHLVEQHVRSVIGQLG